MCVVFVVRSDMSIVLIVCGMIWVCLFGVWNSDRNIKCVIVC